MLGKSKQISQGDSDLAFSWVSRVFLFLRERKQRRGGKNQRVRYCRRRDMAFCHVTQGSLQKQRRPILGIEELYRTPCGHFPVWSKAQTLFDIIAHVQSKRCVSKCKITGKASNLRL